MLAWAVAAIACNQSSSSDTLSGGGSTSDGSTTGDESGATSADTSDGSGGSAGPPKYDVLVVPDEPPPPEVDCNGEPGGGPGSDVDSFIWISNHAESTVSKIDTVSLEEVGRYLTRPDGDGDPSRTSVNLNGDVAVANRSGGLVMIHASIQHCDDRNGDGQIQTSNGPNNVLAWDEEECRGWFTSFDYGTQRPVAWTAGEWNPDACRYEGAKVWTSGARNLGGGGEVDLDDVEVVRVDGDSGGVEIVVVIPEVDPGFFGMYGGAVDADGNFWASQNGLGTLVRVPFDDSAYDTWPMPVAGYGITVDASGYVWTCELEVGRFDPQNEEWMTAAVGGSGGCMADDDGTLWLANDPLVGIDTETLAVVSTIDLPEYVRGVSIDFHGFVWGVTMTDSAFRVDPDTGDFETATGLSSPYTYSDMTGFALASVGGWTPAG